MNHLFLRSFHRSFGNVSLKRVNQFAIVFLLLFTVLFAALLIHDESKQFGETLEKEKHLYLMRQYDEIIKMAWRIEALADFEIDRPESKADLQKMLIHLADVFSESSRRFVYLFAPGGTMLHGEGTIPARVLSGIDFDGNAVSEGIVTVEGGEKPALLYARTLHGGYRIVTGIYTTSTDEEMLRRKEEMKSMLIRIVLEIATLAFIFFTFSLGVSKIVNALLERDVRSFLDFFSGAARSDQIMNPNKTFFYELKKMVFYANDMVCTLSEQRRELQQLNASLEEKVRQKTRALEIKNRDLQTAQHFSESLLASQKQFLRHAIHETNTPLSVIVSNIELFTMKHGKDRHLSKIEAAVKNIFTIYDDLSYLVKKDQVDYPRSAINLNHYLKSRIDFFDEVAEQSKVHFVFEPCAETIHLFFNETKLQRIVDNNLTNAIKYTLPGGVITIRTDMDALGASFEVFSRSKKIEDTQKIFEPYYREDGTVDGFGLGLNLVKAICEEEGVVIGIDSTEDVTRFRYSFKRMAVS